MPTSLLKYVSHDHSCDWLQVNWHKGPCDCGLHAAMDELSLDELNLLASANPDVVESYHRSQREASAPTS